MQEVPRGSGHARAGRLRSTAALLLSSSYGGGTATRPTATPRWQSSCTEVTPEKLCSGRDNDSAPAGCPDPIKSAGGPRVTPGVSFQLGVGGARSGRARPLLSAHTAQAHPMRRGLSCRLAAAATAQPSQIPRISAARARARAKGWDGLESKRRARCAVCPCFSLQFYSRARAFESATCGRSHHLLFFATIVRRWYTVHDLQM
jgi:hypothetical protein